MLHPLTAMTEHTPQENHPDSDVHKGAVESDRRQSPSDESLNGQLGHRDQDEQIKDNDTDYPEPDAAAEHSGGS
ncbi:hypothetical protein ACPOL_5131 [Acidisarcina polymorpha]|uniref:Uncharacterized protein n=2 Tax=Acidisarcina polymorpha TaxID=2211140 RepID=A0A2Z5G6U9_9BACT|nr:hypothetical protein ACPOL_5131 [Acidisarcina polymorpha]